MIGVEQMQPADWGLAALTIVLAVLGLFRGFSGTLAFVSAVAAALFSVTLSWDLTELISDSLWLRRALTLVAVLLVFGIVRWIVKKFVNGLLHQPSDAIFGLVLGVLSGVGVAIGWAISGLYTEYSTVVSMICASLSSQ